MESKTRETPDPNADKGDIDQRGPLGDARPDHDQVDPRTRGGKKQEDVEDRPVVGQVKPEDYPEQM